MEKVKSESLRLKMASMSPVGRRSGPWKKKPEILHSFDKNRTWMANA